VVGRRLCEGAQLAAAAVVRSDAGAFATAPAAADLAFVADIRRTALDGCCVEADEALCRADSMVWGAAILRRRAQTRGVCREGWQAGR
jgi:sugar lactone lactonase YvrE